VGRQVEVDEDHVGLLLPDRLDAGVRVVGPRDNADPAVLERGTQAAQDQGNALYQHHGRIGVVDLFGHSGSSSHPGRREVLLTERYLTPS
jgi:hypothetical protein